jgi:hypothetical protein
MRLEREWAAAERRIVKGQSPCKRDRGVESYVTCSPMDAHCEISHGATPMLDHVSRDSARPSSSRPSTPGSQLSLSEEEEEDGGGDEGRFDARVPISSFCKTFFLFFGRDVSGDVGRAPFGDDSWTCFDWLVLRLPGRGMLLLLLLLVAACCCLLLRSAEIVRRTLFKASAAREARCMSRAPRRGSAHVAAMKICDI